MSRRPNITPEQITQMHALRRQGLTYQKIADILKLDKTTCYYWLNNEKLNAKRIYNKKRRKELSPPIGVKVPKQPPTLPDVEPPPDTRTPIQRHFGDPLPGRSALDMKLKEAPDAPNPPKPRSPFRTPTKDKDESRGFD